MSCVSMSNGRTSTVSSRSGLAAAGSTNYGCRPVSSRSSTATSLEQSSWSRSFVPSSCVCLEAACRFGRVEFAPGDLRLSTQRALVGQVSPKLYGYTIHEDFTLVTDRRQPLATKGTWVLLQSGSTASAAHDDRAGGDGGDFLPRRPRPARARHRLPRHAAEDPRNGRR